MAEKWLHMTPVHTWKNSGSVPWRNSGKEPVPAGDAGLERGLVPGVEHYDSANCDCVPRWQHDDVLAEVSRLQAQLAAQQAVVDAARAEHPGAVLHRWMNPSCRLCVALDKVLAVQPEGEPR